MDRLEHLQWIAQHCQRWPLKVADSGLTPSARNHSGNPWIDAILARNYNQLLAMNSPQMWWLSTVDRIVRDITQLKCLHIYRSLLWINIFFVALGEWCGIIEGNGLGYLSPRKGSVEHKLYGKLFDRKPKMKLKKCFLYASRLVLIQSRIVNSVIERPGFIRFVLKGSPLFQVSFLLREAIPHPSLRLFLHQ